MSGFDKSGLYSYFPVGIEIIGIIKIVGIENVFVAKRPQCLPPLHLLRTGFARYRACFSMKIISMPNVFTVTPTLVGIQTVGIKIGNPRVVQEFHKLSLDPWSLDPWSSVFIAKGLNCRLGYVSYRM